MRQLFFYPNAKVTLNIGAMIYHGDGFFLFVVVLGPPNRGACSEISMVKNKLNQKKKKEEKKLKVSFKRLFLFNNTRHVWCTFPCFTPSLSNQYDWIACSIIQEKSLMICNPKIMIVIIESHKS